MHSVGLKKVYKLFFCGALLFFSANVRAYTSQEAWQILQEIDENISHPVFNPFQENIGEAEQVHSWLLKVNEIINDPQLRHSISGKKAQEIKNELLTNISKLVNNFLITSRQQLRHDATAGHNVQQATIRLFYFLDLIHRSSAIDKPQREIFGTFKLAVYKFGQKRLKMSQRDLHHQTKLYRIESPKNLKEEESPLSQKSNRPTLSVNRGSNAEGIWIRLPNEVDLRFYPWNSKIENLDQIKTSDPEADIEIFRKKDKAPQTEVSSLSHFEIVSMIPLKEFHSGDRKGKKTWTPLELLNFRSEENPSRSFSRAGRCEEIIAQVNTAHLP